MIVHTCTCTTELFYTYLTFPREGRRSGGVWSKGGGVRVALPNGEGLIEKSVHHLRAWRERRENMNMTFAWWLTIASDLYKGDDHFLGTTGRKWCTFRLVAHVSTGQDHIHVYVWTQGRLVQCVSMYRSYLVENHHQLVCKVRLAKLLGDCFEVGLRKRKPTDNQRDFVKDFALLHNLEQLCIAR